MSDVTISSLNASYAPTGPSVALPISDGSSTTKIEVNELLRNAFGSRTTGGVLDWNDVSNTKPGCINNTLLIGTHTNGPQVGGYYHPLNFEYATKNGTGNVTQLAVAYATPGNELCMRGRYANNWSAWVRFLNNQNYTSYVSPAGISGNFNDLTNKPNNAGYAKAWVRINSLAGASTTDGADLTSYIGASYNINRLVKSSNNLPYYIAYFTNPLVANNLCGTGTSYGNANTFCYVAGMTFTNTYVSFAITGGISTGPTSVVVYGL